MSEQPVTDADVNLNRHIPFAPVTTSWTISQGSNSDGPIVVVSVQSPMGETVYFLSPNIAKEIGETILKMGLKLDDSK